MVNSYFLLSLSVIILIQFLLKISAILNLRKFLIHNHLPFHVLVLLPPPCTDPSPPPLVNISLDHHVSQHRAAGLQARDTPHIQIVKDHLKQGRLHHQAQHIARFFWVKVILLLSLSGPEHLLDVDNTPGQS